VNKQFGTGAVYVIPDSTVDSGPRMLGILQEASVNFKGTTKKLYGQKQMPVDSGRANLDVTGKAKLASMSLGLLQAILGGAISTGMKLSVDEVAIVPAVAGPYTITVAHAAAFNADAGVIYQATQVRLKLVTGVPTVGQYAVNATTGVYTFAAADTLKGVVISYIYNDTVNGQTLTLTNQQSGEAPQARLFLFNTHRSKHFGIDLYAVEFQEVGIATKQGDFWMVDVSFDAFCDATDTLGAVYAD
jgi:hypothetical protein